MIEPYFQSNATTIYNGHALEILKQLPDASVQMCMCSPPYWGLRNYAGSSDIVWGGEEKCKHKWNAILKHRSIGGPQIPQSKWQSNVSVAEAQRDTLSNFCSLCGAWRGQLGLEPTPEFYVKHLMMIFSEVKRVLKKDGSFYLNIGDTYASGKGTCYNPRGGENSLEKAKKEGGAYPLNRGNKSTLALLGLQPKSMTLIPERVMFAMIDDGWILRNKVIWHKPNSMPSSVKDRFTTTWEYVYFFTKAGRYYFNLDAVREPHKTQSLERYRAALKRGEGGQGKVEEGIGAIQHRIGMDGIVAIPKDISDLFGHGPQPQSFNLRVRDVKRGKVGTTAQGGELKASEKEVDEYEYPESTEGQFTKHDLAVGRLEHFTYPDPLHIKEYSPKGKNPGDIIQEYEYPETPFQTKKEPYLNNNPHIMRLQKDKYIALDPEHPNDLSDSRGKNPGDYWDITTKGFKGAHFAVYPERLCERPIRASSRVGDTVLDPFAGSGTTGVVAKRLGRKCILIDSVESYCAIAKARIANVEYQPELVS